jgi:signal transduction histidine kinase
MQSEKLAAVGRMASSMAHEINNPLEAVTNLLFLARKNAAKPDVAGWLDQAELELRRVSVIANQTLRFHKQSTNPREISCVDLYSTVLNLYEARLRNHGIRVEKRKRASRPVECFEGDVRQILSNLVTNAIDAMPEGGCLYVRSREGTDWRTGRKGLVLTLADSGIGMSEATQRRMFEAFFSTKGIGGAGLGLWISADIMQRHQGRILIRSSQRKDASGTVVTLFLPFDASRKPSETVQQPAATLAR